MNGDLSMSVFCLCFLLDVSVCAADLKDVEKRAIWMVNKRDEVSPQKLSAFRRTQPGITENRNAQTASVTGNIVAELLGSAFPSAKPLRTGAC